MPTSSQPTINDTAPHLTINFLHHKIMPEHVKSAAQMGILLTILCGY